MTRQIESLTESDATIKFPRLISLAFSDRREMVFSRVHRRHIEYDKKKVWDIGRSKQTRYSSFNRHV